MMMKLPFEPPVQQVVHPVFEAAGVDVFIKREDLIHPFISGNKWRKLKYVLEDAVIQQKKLLVSFGGAYSNHLVALANAGAVHGFKTKAFVRGEEVHNHMLGLCRSWGMELEFISRELYRDKQALFDLQYGDNTDAYFIDEGGRGALAAKGCGEMLDGVKGFSHVICAIGTGTTFAGLVNAARGKGMKSEGICVLKGAEAIEEDILKLTGSADGWKVHHRFHEGGYAKTTPELFAFMDAFAANTGILLDQVYTGKMMKAVISLVQEQYYKPGDRLLLIHTGGLLGLLSRWS
jgi:1-aminocyclopropane-1-carboxylate deaminase